MPLSNSITIPSHPHPSPLPPPTPHFMQSVNANADKYDIPMDVIWLDIEHTDGKKYFTWDSARFPDSRAMIDHVASYGRKVRGEWEGGEGRGDGRRRGGKGRGWRKDREVC